MTLGELYYAAKESIEESNGFWFNAITRYLYKTDSNIMVLRGNSKKREIVEQRMGLAWMLNKLEWGDWKTGGFLNKNPSCIYYYRKQFKDLLGFNENWGD